MRMFPKLTIVVGLTSATLFAAETAVQMKDLPEAVQKTVHEQTRNAKLNGLAKEVENGKTFYEAETTVNGKSRDVLIDPAGTVVEIEEATDLANIPEPAQKALKAQAGSGKILSVETVIKGSVVNYEGVIEKGGKRSEVAVKADGSLIQ